MDTEYIKNSSIDELKRKKVACYYYYFIRRMKSFWIHLRNRHSEEVVLESEFIWIKTPSQRSGRHHQRAMTDWGAPWSWALEPISQLGRWNLFWFLTSQIVLTIHLKPTKRFMQVLKTSHNPRVTHWIRRVKYHFCVILEMLSLDAWRICENKKKEQA